jgi:hypothetical protein
VIFSNKVSSKSVGFNAIQQSQNFEYLDSQTKQIVTALSSLKSSITQDIRGNTIALTQLLNRRDVVVEVNGVRTHKVIVDAYRHPGLLVSAGDEADELLERTRKEEAQLHTWVAEEILGNLHFESISDRYEQVSEAHAQTFRWIFEPEQSSPECKSGFVEWLENNEPLYWINGKAASGKSTLMKYIYDNQKTREHLSIWARGFPLCVVDFFFWNSGTSLQKSQAGLLRSILYHALRQAPNLLPVVLPVQWAKIYSRKVRSSGISQV